MKIFKDGQQVAEINHDQITTKDKQLEEFFYELVDEGIPVLQRIESKGSVGDVETRVPFNAESINLLPEILIEYGYEARP